MSLAANSVAENEIDLTAVTLADFTNDLALTSANIFVGNGSNIATGVAMSGDATIDNTGVLTISDNAVDGTDIALGGEALGDVMYYDGTNWVNLGVGTDGYQLTTHGAALAPTWEAAGGGGATQLSDLTDVSSVTYTDGQLLIAQNTTTDYQSKSISGDATLSAAGLLTVTGIQGRTVASTAPTDGQILKWNNSLTQWEPAADGGSSSSGPQKTVLHPEYPGAVLNGSDKVYMTSGFDNGAGKTNYYRLKSATSGMQQYDIVFLWSMPTGITTLDSVRLYYRTHTTAANTDSVTFSAVDSSGTPMISNSGCLRSSVADTWARKKMTSSTPADYIIFTIVLTSDGADQNNYADVGKLEIFWTK